MTGKKSIYSNTIYRLGVFYFCMYSCKDFFSLKKAKYEFKGSLHSLCEVCFSLTIKSQAKETEQR